jgi:hypothetical protein
MKNQETETKEKRPATDTAGQTLQPAEAGDLPSQFCPVCSKRLESWRCKMICPRCGYFVSCSEFEKPPDFGS